MKRKIKQFRILGQRRGKMSKQDFIDVLSPLFNSLSIPLVVLAKLGCNYNNRDCERNEHNDQRRCLTTPMELLGNETRRNSRRPKRFYSLLLCLLDGAIRCHPSDTTTWWSKSQWRWRAPRSKFSFRNPTRWGWHVWKVPRLAYLVCLWVAINFLPSIISCATNIKYWTSTVGKYSVRFRVPDGR